MNITIGYEKCGEYGQHSINSLLSQLYKDCNIIWTQQPDTSIDFMVSSTDGKAWNTQKHKYIVYSGEPWVPEEPENSTKTLFITATKEENSIHIPYFFMCPHLRKEKAYKENYRPFLLAYCSTNPIKQRETFFSMMVSKTDPQRCHSLGNCNGQRPETKRKIVRGKWDSMKLINEYSKYTFVIAMENCQKEGYITEKLINAYYAGAIPIYWGAPDINEYFNPKAFINVSDFEDFDACTEYILSLPESKITEMQNEELYLNKNYSIASFETITKLKNFIEQP